MGEASTLQPTYLNSHGILAQIKLALGIAELAPPERRTEIVNADDVRVSDNVLEIGPEGREVARAELDDLHGVLLSPVRGRVGYVDAIFRAKKRSGRLSRQYAGTFRTETPAFQKLQATLKSYRLS